MIYLNGRILPPDQARIDPGDRGLLLGDGLFETIRCVDGAPRHLGDHLARLSAGAAVLDIPVTTGEDELGAGVATLLAANSLDRGIAALRITLTRGPGPRGVLPPDEPTPTMLMSVAPSQASSAPARAHISAVRRNEQSPLSRLKTLNYLDAIVARRDAARAGADEAILLNTVGRLACASVANLFLVRGRSLFTPPLSEGVLPGITRARVLSLAPAQGLSPIETPLEINQLTFSDEAFLTNSLISIRPLVAVGDQDLGDGATGPVTARLIDALEDQAA